MKCVLRRPQCLEGEENPSEGAVPSACNSKVLGTAFRCRRAGVCSSPNQPTTSLT
jgi:hypothetical protein